MDATYKDTITAQLEGNPFIDYEIKEGLLKILWRFSEDELKNVTKQDKNRFFYKSKLIDVAARLRDEMPSTEKRKLQTQANKAAREGRKLKNKFTEYTFPTTYTRSGHKYVNGKREY